MKSARVEILAHPLFDGANPSALVPILSRVLAREVRAGQMLARPEEGSCFLVFEGALLSYVLHPDGRRVMFEVIRSGGIDGVLALGFGVRGHFSQAAERSVVAPFDRRVFEALTDVEPVIARAIVHLSLVRLRRREAQLEAATQHEAIQRVASMLLSLIEDADPALSCREGGLVPLSPRPTHQVLADMIGLRRETVTKEIGTLTRLGAVRVHGSALIVDRRLLTDAAEKQIRRRIQGLPGASTTRDSMEWSRRQ